MMSITERPTIAAISTPPGPGGVGVIRVSGDDALAVLHRIFRPCKTISSFVSHKFYYGHIIAPGTDKIVDEVLAVYMQSPRSYTREDVVEIHCHGSFLILQNVLELVLAHGAVLAVPGEFTKRAFLNGRIDLTQAEAVIDILTAKTHKGVDIAQQQLSGSLYNEIALIREHLIEVRALVEVAIDFPDEDIEILDRTALLAMLAEKVAQPLEHLVRNADQGRIYREGVSVVIAGRPNVGKSSLLNTLLREERALVTDIPGTTRDSIEEYIDIYGMPVRLVDTAGIRGDAARVEELGIQRAKNLINEADLVLFLLDGSQPVSEYDREVFRDIADKPLVVVVNKSDLGVATCDVAAIQADLPQVIISAKEKHGIEKLKKAVFQAVTMGVGQWEEEGCVPNLRHKKALEKASQACARIQDAFLAGQTVDLIAVDLQECLDQLAEIVGETTTEDILDTIFNKFCLGK